MPAKPVQIISGVDAIRGANAYREALQSRRDAWPYPHVYPPPNADDVHAIGTLAILSAASGIQEIVKYVVNSGKRFFLRAVLLSTQGAGSLNPGDVLFTVDRNLQIGVPSNQFQPEHGLVNIGIQLGASNIYPWPLQMARIFEPNDVVRIKGTNVNVGGGLGGGFYACGMFGYEVPVLDVRPGK